VPGWLRSLILDPTPAGRPTSSGPATGATGATVPAGRKALERVVGQLAITPPGSRNDTLNRTAHFLGQLVAAHELDALEAVEAVLAVVDHWPDHRKSVGTIQRAMADGMRTPRRTR
jgi:hypothetical protein